MPTAMMIGGDPGGEQPRRDRYAVLVGEQFGRHPRQLLLTEPDSMSPRTEDSQRKMISPED